MQQIIFKQLFELRLLHSFYLDGWYHNESGLPGVFFDFGDSPSKSQLEKQSFILERKYNVQDHISIVPTPATERLLQDRGIICRTTPHGLVAGIRASRKQQGNEVRFFPSIPLSASDTITFLMKLKNGAWPVFTQHALHSTFPAAYYFSNLRAEEEGKAFPSLSCRLPSFEGNRTWEMGELILDGLMVKTANKTTRSVADFSFTANTATGAWRHYAHSGDRCALPKMFAYRLDPIFGDTLPAVTHAEFRLNTDAGDPVKSLVFEQPVPDEVNLDFRHFPLAPEETRPRAITDGWYRLSVRIHHEVFEEKRILLLSELDLDPGIFGVVEIGMGNTADPFRVLHTDGSLKLAATETGRLHGPVFDVRWMNRLTYWRYHFEQRGQRNSNDPDFELDMHQRRITTVAPRRLTMVAEPLSIQLTTGEMLLPAPEPAHLQYDNESKKYYSDSFLTTF